MKVYPFCDPYVWENPKVLLSTRFALKYHKEGVCMSEYVNILVLIFTVAFFIGSFLSVFMRSSQPILVSMGIALLYSIPFIWDITRIQTTEPFANATGTGTGTGKPATAIYDVIGAQASTVTMPTTRNPFMNVLIDEIKYNPTRPIAMSITDPSVQVKLDDFFRTEFTADPTDVFGRSQSQRQFITMPSTSIPNDQNSYQNWLYKIPGKTCKEGGREACLPGTDGGAIPWLNANPA